MAPEQALGKSAGPGADVFALGALAMYAAARVAPFGEGNDAALLYRIVHEEPDLSQCPEELRDLVRRCLAKEPGDRPSPAEIIAECSQTAAGTSLKITDGWLPPPVTSDIARRTTAPIPPEPVPAAVAAAMSTPPGLPPTRVEGPGNAQKPRKRWGLRLSLAAVLVIGGAVGGAFGYKALNKTTAAPGPQLPAGAVSQNPGGGAGQPSSSPQGGATTNPAGSSSGSSTPTDDGLATETQRPSDTTTVHNNNNTPGTQLGLYQSVSLPSGYGIDFTHDPTRPVSTASYGGDESMGYSFSSDGGRFEMPTAVVFAANVSGTYDNCLNRTEYQHNVSMSQLQIGSLFCVHTASSKFVLVKIDKLPDAQQANPYVVVDMTIWQGK
jgi:serine/threonine protein kinase